MPYAQEWFERLALRDQLVLERHRLASCIGDEDCQKIQASISSLCAQLAAKRGRSAKVEYASACLEERCELQALQAALSGVPDAHAKTWHAWSAAAARSDDARRRLIDALDVAP